MNTSNNKEQVSLIHIPILEFIEYSLLFSVIVECNSLFVYSENYRQAPVATILNLLTVGITGILILLNLLLSGHRGDILKGFLRYLPVLIAIYVWNILFFFFNVQHITNSDWIREYIISFLLLLPLMCLLFAEYRIIGKTHELLLKYSDLVCCFAIVNLAVYFSVVFHPASVYAQITMSRWSNLGYLRTFHNYLNFCNVELVQIREIAGFLIYRNQGFFTEPLMFAIPLITALSTELFLRKKDRRKPWKWAVLLLTIFTTQATLGIMIAAVVCGAKVLESSGEERKKKLLVPVSLVVIGVCAVLFAQKANLSGESSFSSLAVHIEDYKLALRAFLKHPILGNGFQNEGAIQAFMTAERLERNRGLSNSIAIVLAEGGIVLGLMCMLPFAICFAAIRSANKRALAFWVLGPFGLYCLTIFHFHAFLLMLMAFGYGLIEVRESSEKKRLCLVYAETDRDIMDDEEFQRWPGVWKNVLVEITVLLAMFLLFSEGFWRIIYSALMRNQLYLGQSAWKAYFFFLFLILFAVVLRFTVQSILRNKDYRKEPITINKKCSEWKKYTVWFAGYSIVYIILYPTIYSWVSTFLGERFYGGDLIESFILGGLLFGGVFLGWGILWCYEMLGRRGNVRLRWIPVFVSLSLVTVSLFGIFRLNQRIREDRYLPTDISSVLMQAVDETGGTLFSNELAVLVRKDIPNTTYSATRDGGFSAYHNCSVLTRHNENLRELIDSGFEVAELSSDYLLYSNDERMIQNLKGKGFTFYKFFAFDQPVNLRNLAAYNRVIYAGGEIRVEGKDGSVLDGPYDVIKNGEYTVEYKLHRTPDDSPVHELIGTLSIQSYYGKKEVKNREVYADEFDAQGGLTAELAFSSGDWEGMEYLAIADGSNEFQIKSITLRETPKYIVQKTYNGRKQVVREAYYTLSGEPYIQAEGYSVLAKEYDRIGRVRTQRYYDSDYSPVRIRAGYARIDKEYDKTGRVIREEYYDINDQLTELPQGYAALEQGFDSEGHVNDIRYYDAENNPVIIANGYAEVRKVFDLDGRVLKETFYDDSGKVTRLPAGYASCEYEYDEAGNAKILRYLDENNSRIALTQNYAELHRDYDINRHIIRESYFDEDGNPVDVPQGYAVNEREYDDAGNAIVQRYCDAQGKLVMTTWNYAEVHRVFSPKRWTLEECYFGADGKPLTLPQGYWLTEWQYDELGNPVTIKYYDIDNQPVLTTAGYAEVHREYNDKNQIAKESYYNTDGQLLTMPQGYAYNEREYDDAGNVSVQRYLDAEGNPVMTTWNYAEVHREFNEKRQIVRESYFGIDGEPVNMPQGYAVNDREYDEAGNANLQRYCDASGTPVITTWNYAEVHRVYDDSKRVIEERYYGVDGKPITLPAGNAGVAREYNEKNQIIKEAYYDTNGKLTTMPQGYSYNEREYDEAGNAAVQRYLDADEKPVITTWGYAEVHRTFDDNRRVIQEKYYNTDGQPMVLPSRMAGDVRIYDEAGRLIVQKFVDLNEKPVMLTAGYAELHRAYNEKNQVNKESYYDTEEKPVVLPQGYTANERAYDEAGNANVQRYLGIDGKLVMTTWNYAEVHRVFDDSRRVIEESYFGTDGKPFALPAGYAEVHREYNEKNQVIKESYYDTNREPFVLAQGYAVNVRGYDEAGNASMQQYCDASGNPVITTWNYAEVHRVFDENHRVIEERYFGTDGKPLLLPSGQGGDTRSYDENGRLAVQKFFDINGKPVMLTSGYAEFHREYNEKGQISRESYYDSNGKPAVLPQGYSINEREYDEAGNASVQRYLDANGQPVMTSWGYAEVHREYNDKRQVISEKYYDTEGKEISK